MALLKNPARHERLEIPAGGDAPPAVYLLDVPTRHAQLMYQEVLLLGVSAAASARGFSRDRAPARDEVLDIIANGVRSVLDGSDEDRAAVLDAIEAFRADPADAAAAALVDQAEAALAGWPVWREVAMLQALARGHAVTAAVQVFCAGWQNVPEAPPFRREAGVVPDELVAALPAEHCRAIFSRVQDLMAPTAAEAKNSGSRPASPSAASPSAETQPVSQPADRESK